MASVFIQPMFIFACHQNSHDNTRKRAFSNENL